MIKLSTLCSALLTFSAVGCIDDDGGGGGPGPGWSGGKGDGWTLEGSYAMNHERANGTLKIVSAAPTGIEFNLTVVNTTGGNNFAEVSGQFLPRGGDVYSFIEGDDCEIVMQAHPDLIQLTQTGRCTEAGFGAFVSASGIYDRVRPVLAGEYRMATDTGNGTLTITSVQPSSIAFSLSVVRTVGEHSFGEVSGKFLTDDAGVLAYRNGDDCTITLTQAGDGISLAQAGTCAAAGFQPLVIATGEYHRQVPITTGTYAMGNDTTEATLTVTSVFAGDIDFNLTVVRTVGGNNFGEIDGTFVPADDGSSEYVVGEDCAINVTTFGAQIALTQWGTCAEAGFGAFVNATGFYSKQ